MKMLILLVLLTINSYSQEYVTPEELEEGWGFGYDYPLSINESVAPRVITNFNIIEKESFIYVEYQPVLGNQNYIFEMFYDLQNKKIVDYNWIYKSNFSKNEDFYVFYNEKLNNLYLKNKFEEVVLYCNDLNNCDLTLLNSCYIGKHILSNDSGNYSYLINKNNEKLIDIYKINLDSLIINRCPIYELVINTEISNENIIFPKNEIFNFITPNLKFNIPYGFEYYKEFSLIRNINLPKKDNWSVSISYDTFHYFMKGFNKVNNIKMGNFGDVYIYTSFRSESEPNSDNYKPENHPEGKEARDASGIYRIDTNGNNAVQLVRSWTNHPGGLQISGDGETIYYAYILPDSTSAIMKMDRFGKNKEIVFKLDPELLSVEKQVLTPKIYPNPANETITISGIAQGKVEIFNSLGQLRIQSEIQGNSTINTSNLQTGIYIIKIESNSEVKFEKLLINK